ncbi:protein kinase, core domain containing protein [Dorcoceras hygrometricum]|uniref:Protein kinase, core domain containing protein n=1 Tax=Dorcoceras hygrometricum TaxID=472368 RepID=A0A2Z7AHJ0_9LAMI|nr:protein kinase, core domain containing protein [Dorcoceras hygrometricum]
MRRRAKDQQMKKSEKREATSYGEATSRKSLFISRELQCNQQLVLVAIAKRCRLHKLIRQRFALALKIQQEDFALRTSRELQRMKRRSRRSEEVQPVARFSRKIQQKRKRSSSRLEPAAKQLTTYKELRELDVNC